MFKGLTLFVILCAAGPSLAQESEARIAALSCAVCHGSDGEAIPAIRGRPYEGLRDAMESFRGDAGTATIMHRFVAGLSEPEIDSLARYISMQEEVQ